MKEQISVGVRLNFSARDSHTFYCRGFFAYLLLYLLNLFQIVSLAFLGEFFKYLPVNTPKPNGSMLAT